MAGRKREAGTFITLDKTLIKNYIHLERFTEKTLLLYIWLTEYANDEEGGLAWPSQYRLQKDTGMDRKTIRAHLKTLEEYGLIKRSETDHDGNAYFVYDPVDGAEFNARFPQVYDAKEKKAEKVDGELHTDKKRLQAAKDAKKEREEQAVQQTQVKQAPQTNQPRGRSNGLRDYLRRNGTHDYVQTQNKERDRREQAKKHTPMPNDQRYMTAEEIRSLF